MVNFLKDLRTMNIYTIERFSSKVFARTTIELDADIITLVSNDILDNKVLSMLAGLHRSNVQFVNQLFEYQMKKLCQTLKVLRSIIRIASLTPFGVSLIPFSSSILHGLSQGSFQPVVISTIISTLLYIYTKNPL
jgi:hypothetical protein